MPRGTTLIYLRRAAARAIQNLSENITGFTGEAYCYFSPQFWNEFHPSFTGMLTAAGIPSLDKSLGIYYFPSLLFALFNFNCNNNIF
jgi:hypothetical protein